MHLGAFSLCLILLGVSSAGQFAFGYLNAARLRYLMQHGASRSQAMAQVLHRPGPFLSSIVLLHMSIVGIATLVAFDLASHLTTDAGWRAGVLAVAAALALAAQIIARGLAALHPERVAVWLYGPLRIVGTITMPLVGPWYALTELMVTRIAGARPQETMPTTEEDLRVLVDAVEETEALEEEEREMITSIFEMSDRDVSEIMVPRIDLVAIDASTSVGDGLDVLVRSGHSRVPVYEEDLDHVTGLVHLRDLAREFRAGNGSTPVGDLVRPLHVVPETKKIDELLHEFQEKNIQMALVADEYGGTAGIVTIEDMLEEIVGEIRDEYDVEEERIHKISDREANLDARVSIHDVNELLPLHLDDDDYDTVGGLVYERLSKIPSAGDVVDLGHAVIRVISTKGRRVQRVHITMTEQRSNASPGNGNGATAEK